jgi:hypothetical protein
MTLILVFLLVIRDVVELIGHLFSYSSMQLPQMLPLCLLIED